MVEAVFARLDARSPSWSARMIAGFDHYLVYAFGILAVLGLVISFAAGPVVAGRIGIADPFYFTERHVLFLALTVIGTVGTAMLPVSTARRLGILVGLSALILIVGVLLFGIEIKGAKRWLHVAGFGLQPSEFFKPGFIMAAAWFLSAKPEDGFPGSLVSLGFYGVASILLLLQPDYGQWILLTGVWAVMFFVAGWSWAWIGGLGSAAAAAMAIGYVTQDHVRSRIDRFLAPGSGETYQTDKAAEAISSGGIFGHDLHEAAGVKASIPDAHSDFVYAVAVEEFGVIMGLVIIGLFAVIGWRGLVAALSTEDVFKRCAIAGLTSAICLQAAINIGVNVGMLPAKGMTLPFISYGGSSILAMGFTAGLLLVLTRRHKA